MFCQICLMNVYDGHIKQTALFSYLFYLTTTKNRHAKTYCLRNLCFVPRWQYFTLSAKNLYSSSSNFSVKKLVWCHWKQFIYISNVNMLREIKIYWIAWNIEGITVDAIYPLHGFETIFKNDSVKVLIMFLQFDSSIIELLWLIYAVYSTSKTL